MEVHSVGVPDTRHINDVVFALCFPDVISPLRRPRKDDTLEKPP